VAPTQEHPLDADQLRATYAFLLAGILGVRDRALFGRGFAGGLRSSGLVAHDVPNLHFVRTGLEAFVGSSKTNKEGRGLTKVIAGATDPAACTVRAVRDWLELAGITEDPVYRPVTARVNLKPKRLSDHAVATVLKRSAAAAGFSVDEVSDHSQRAGFAKSGKMNGADDAAIMDPTATPVLTCCSATFDARRRGEACERELRVVRPKSVAVRLGLSKRRRWKQFVEHAVAWALKFVAELGVAEHARVRFVRVDQSHCAHHRATVWRRADGEPLRGAEIKSHLWKLGLFIVPPKFAAK
jgi:hypothetical protein